MRKVLSVIACSAVIGMAGTAFGAPITFTDTTLFTATGTNAAEDYVGHGGGNVNVIGDNVIGKLLGAAVYGPDYVEWEHQFTFNPGAESILGANLAITLSDDVDFELKWYYNNWRDFGFRTTVDTNDSVKEFAAGWAEDWTWDIGEVDTGTLQYSVGVNYLADGSFFVKIGNLGLTDFNIVRSDLTVTYNPVPEPATMLLFGTGLAGLAAVSRRRKK